MKTDHFDRIDNEYECIIIGGGIVGAGILRDLSLNNVKSLLIDKKDFSSQTSSKSSKMLHGGIRYLENLDFELVYEALHEKNLWLKKTPHLCYESSFYMPVFNDSLRPKWMLKIGLFLYDLLSGFKQSPHAMLSKSEIIQKITNIKKDKVLGCGLYHDAIVDDARMVIECIVDATMNKQSDAINHCEVIEYNLTNQLISVQVKDRITHQIKTITCKEIIFATGPFTDDLMSSIKEINWSPKLLPSKGSHLWLKKDVIKTDNPIVLTPKDGRVIFVIPQKEKCLVGTTEVEHDGDKFDIQASQREIEYLMTNLEEYFDIKIKEDDILSSFCGIRPLVMDANNSRAKTARHHQIFQPRSNVHIIIGGKYTTFRVMAKDISRKICQKLNKGYNSRKSEQPFRFRPYFYPFEPDKNSPDYEQLIRDNEFVRTEQDYLRRIE